MAEGCCLHVCSTLGALRHRDQPIFASNASTVRAEYTIAAPALTIIATASASTTSSLVAPALIAASVWALMHPSQRSVIATPSAISSRVFASTLHWPDARRRRPLQYPDWLWPFL